MLSFFHLIVSPPESSVLYAGRYDPVLVSLSILAAVFSSYAALLVSQHVSSAATTMARRLWTAGGGLCMGIGVWAMHFVGMLAFSLPCTSSYDPLITVLSTIPSIFASTLAISIISRRKLSRTHLAAGGLLIGAGIGAMHYSGMAAMHLNGMIRYDIKLFLLSLLVAVVLATLALWIKFRLQTLQTSRVSAVTLASATVMGLAVSGMHYTAMAAAYFIRGDETAVTSGMEPPFLAAIVLTATSLLIVVTIVATYAGKGGKFFSARSNRFMGFFIAAWLSISWLSADYYHDHLTGKLHRQELQIARQQAEQLAGDIDENIALLKGVSLVFAQEEETRLALSRFGVHAAPPPPDYEARKQRWTRDKALDKLNKSLKIAASHLGADNIFIINAEGDCIAAGNADQPGSFVGTNYADREYFRQARAGKNGHQYAVGRTTNIPGLYYARPVFDAGHFFGAVVVKRNISQFARWTKPANAFIADINGVIVLTEDKSMELRSLPGAPVALLSAEEKLVLYRQSVIEPLALTSWDNQHATSAVLMHGSPVVLASKRLQEDDITIFVPRPLDELVQLDTEGHGLFFLLAAAGSMLIIAASSIVLYLRESQKAATDLRIAATVFDAQEGMVICDADNRVLRVNRAFTDITGYSAEEITGKNPGLLSSNRHDANFYKAMWESINSTGSWKGEIWNRRKSGEIYPEHLIITAVTDPAGTVTNYVATFSDITVSKAAADEIQHLAFYDQLTRLPNRRLLTDRIGQAMSSGARSGKLGALLFIDLDNFKTLNDTLGHDIGDLLLQQVAQRLQACVRDGDTVARMGGDEFVVILEELGEHPFDAATQTEMVSNKILAALNQTYHLATNDFRNTPSIGITLFSGHEQDIDELFKQADIAMYQAKKAGRNTLRFFDPSMQTAITNRVALESDLRRAVFDEDQLQLYYQPQVNSHGNVVGAEALVRWRHPERGMVSPTEFIPLAEESGLILPLGHWVLATACRQVAEWGAHPDTSHLTMSVNISAKQFQLLTFVEEVLALIDHFGIDPAKLKLEITETMLLDNMGEIIEKMTALKARGINFSMDDFGTGYSSLQYLKRLPLNQLKIDQSFVRDIASDASDKAIVRTIIAMAHSLSLDVIAEGVETEEQRKFLLKKGCTLYQGFLFAKPMPIGQFEALLKK